MSAPLWLSPSLFDDTPPEPRRGNRDRIDHADNRSRASGTDACDPDQALLVRLRHGDESALAHLFTTYTPRLERYAATVLGTTDAARDVVQDAFIALWNGRETIEIRTTLRAYLYASVRGRALMTLRSTRARVARQARFDENEALRQFPTSSDDDKELLVAVERSFEELPPRTREVARLRWIEGLTYAEIAATCGTSPRTVDNQLRAAARILRVRLAPFRRTTQRG